MEKKNNRKILEYFTCKIKSTGSVRFKRAIGEQGSTFTAC